MKDATKQSQDRIDRGIATRAEPETGKAVLSWPRGIIVIAASAGAAWLIVVRLVSLILG